MKIVDRKTFLAMPKGTVFAKYAPHWFGEITIKEQTYGNDWWEQRLLEVDCDGAFSDAMDAALAGEKFDLDLACLGRDGLFDADQLFAVFEPHDVEGLIYRLQRALLDTANAATAPKGNP